MRQNRSVVARVSNPCANRQAFNVSRHGLEAPAKANRSAFATIFVLVLLAIVMTALAGLIVVSRIDHRRTTTAVVEAQLRQVAMAAIIDASSRAVTATVTAKSQTWNTEIPGGAGSCHSEVLDVSKDHLRIRMTCRVGENRSAQILRFGLADSKWRLVEIQPAP